MANPDAGQAQANARLIAAAPEMLAVLARFMRMTFESLSGEEECAIIEAGLAACAKALGEEE